MRKYISYLDVKKEYRDDYFIRNLLAIHNTLAHMEHGGKECWEEDKELSNIMDYLEKEELWLAMYIEERRKPNSDDFDYPGLQGKLVKTYMHDVIRADDQLECLLKPVRRQGEPIGIKDKNGRSIYANDVVRTKYGRIALVTRLCNDGYCGFDLLPYDKIECRPPDNYDLWKPENLEVVNEDYPYEKLEDNRKPTE